MPVRLDMFQNIVSVSWDGDGNGGGGPPENAVRYRSNSFVIDSIFFNNDPELVVNKPPGSVEGDVVVAVMGYFSLGSPGEASAPDDDWKSIFHVSHSEIGATKFNAVAWRKVLGPSEPSTYEFLSGPSTNNTAVLTLNRFDRVDVADPIAASEIHEYPDNVATSIDSNDIVVARDRSLIFDTIFHSEFPLFASGANRPMLYDRGFNGNGELTVLASNWLDEAAGVHPGFTYFDLKFQGGFVSSVVLQGPLTF